MSHSMRVADEVYVANREEWHKWLKKNHATKKEVWLVYYKKSAGKPSVSYDDAVEEALCFGWIDSIIRRIDDERFARKFTPRRSRSKWSEANKARAVKMMKKGKMMKAGLATIREAKRRREWFRTVALGNEVTFPLDLHRKLATNKKALDNFNNLANGYKKLFVRWVATAKKQETREKRLKEAIRLLEQNKKLGLK